MEVDPMESAGSAAEESASADRAKARLSTWVAITVALLATFMCICKVKDDNIVQAMQQAQAKSVDYWAWYQARKIRADVLQATADQFKIQADGQPALKQAYLAKSADYQKQADKQKTESADTQKEAKGFDDQYDKLNIHDDQFDLSDAALSVAIALLALTALTQRFWLFGLAMVPSIFGVVMGLAGLLSWGIHPNALTKLLS